MDYVARAIKHQPDKVECLIMKCKCLLKAQRLKDTLECSNLLIEKMKKDKKLVVDPDILIVKGDALYHMGSFEHALVSYYRALNASSSKVSTQNTVQWAFYDSVRLSSFRV